jgi:hypothetical protein
MKSLFFPNVPFLADRFCLAGLQLHHSSMNDVTGELRVAFDR